jgi:3D (Asp-Asp-Asp) domain-containing protein
MRFFLLVFSIVFLFMTTMSNSRRISYLENEIKIVAVENAVLDSLNHKQTELITKLIRTLSERVEEIKEQENPGIRVKVTMYNPVPGQTDDTPDITADGTRLQLHNASEYRYIALSRNLLKRWGGPFDYGDFIYIKGIDKKSGVYQVRDTMNERWVNRVDILESDGTDIYSYHEAEIVKTTVGL